MIENLRAAKVKKNELSDNIFILKKNSPKQIDKNNNSHTARIDEDETKEILLVSSIFDDDAFAMIGNEFCLNFLNNSKKVDLTYYYFSTDKEVTIYLYDMKKTFTEVDVIFHLIEQWTSSVRIAKFCIDELDGYKTKSIKIGVITENNDIDRREKAIHEIINDNDSSINNSSKMPSSIISKHKARMSGDIKKKKLLSDILNGKVSILEDTYTYDIRLFDEKRTHCMCFTNGILDNVKTTSN